ncbi:MAG TPA: glycine zipper 2TM domain-containing protein [Rhodocyclaceae bacterium]|nr:glycine zipper 2TM domain-containing protein [Rhodocyclaceae bacterium]
MSGIPAARPLAVALAAALMLVSASGCENMQKREWGTLFGAAIGGAIGHRLGKDSASGTVIGALIGGVVGRMIGQYMDDADRKRLAETIDTAPRGQTVSWHNEDTGRDFAVTPTSDFYADAGKECRRFDQVVYVDGRREVMEGIACRTPGEGSFDFSGQSA